MSEQIDIAVDLGVILAPLPEIKFLREFVADLPQPPPQLIEGILHQGCKMVLGGTSKSNKSWCLLNLGLSVGLAGRSGGGAMCAKCAVLYINFELHAWAIAERLNALCTARPECKVLADGHCAATLHFWNLRGHNADMTRVKLPMEASAGNRGLTYLRLAKRARKEDNEIS